jgi:hypothetical protein
MTFSDRGVWSSAAGGAPDFVEDFNRFGTQIVDFSQAPVVFQDRFASFISWSSREEGWRREPVFD